MFVFVGNFFVPLYRLVVTAVSYTTIAVPVYAPVIIEGMAGLTVSVLLNSGENVEVK
ncbi:MAG: hypothetical protein Kow0080_20440 [Candidatus Promineifilaceae bacterium]